MVLLVVAGVARPVRADTVPPPGEVGVPGQAEGPPPGGLWLITEENPPLNFTDPATGRLAGLAGELVPLLAAQAGIPYTLSVMPWRRGYRLTQETRDTCLFAINETPERQPLFAWVGPLLRGGAALFARPDWHLPPDASHPQGRDTLDGLADLAALHPPLSVLTQVGSILGPTLRADGAVVTEVEMDRLMPMLAAGRADLVLSGQITGPWLARAAGVAVREVYAFPSPPVAIACNSATDPSLLDRLRASLDQARAAGTVNTIIARYR